ncbi:hypothetical protein D3C76_1233510 [compost metagenome]
MNDNSSQRCLHYLLWVLRNRSCDSPLSTDVKQFLNFFVFQEDFNECVIGRLGIGSALDGFNSLEEFSLLCIIELKNRAFEETGTTHDVMNEG